LIEAEPDLRVGDDNIMDDNVFLNPNVSQVGYVPWHHDTNESAIMQQTESTHNPKKTQFHSAA
jgi:hypothetical protein